MARCYARAPSPVQALPGANQDHFHPPGTLLDTLSSAVLVTDESDTVLSGSAYDYATLAYDAATGHQRWATAYAGPGKNNVATSLTVNPATGTVYVTGYSTGNTSGNNYATIAYNPATGTQLWASRYDGPGSLQSTDQASSVAVSPATGTVFVTGGSGAPGFSEYATVAYHG